jgi:hypothetical protein
MKNLFGTVSLYLGKLFALVVKAMVLTAEAYGRCYCMCYSPEQVLWGDTCGEWRQFFI